MAKLGITLLLLHIIRFLDSFEKCYSLIPITNLTCILCNIPNARISSWKFGGQWFEDDFCVLDIHIFDFSLTKLQSLDSLYTMIINFNHLIVFSTNNFDDIKWFQLLRFRYFFIRLLRYRYMSVDDNTHTQEVCIFSAMLSNFMPSLNLNYTTTLWLY